MDKVTTPCHELSIGEMIIDEFLRLDTRPDWQPGRKPLEPGDFLARSVDINTGQATTPVRMGVKNV